MAFLKRTWLARIGTGLNKFIIGNKDGEGKQTLTNAPDSVTQIGDVISAENLNDLEDRIYNEFDSQNTRINQKQNLLTFDVTPKAGSTNPVESNGVYMFFTKTNAYSLNNTINFVDGTVFTIDVTFTIANDKELFAVTEWAINATKDNNPVKMACIGYSQIGNTVTARCIALETKTAVTVDVYFYGIIKKKNPT